MVRKKIIIDTDPGQDDAVAILLALASDELEILAITTVAGNVPLALSQTNALQDLRTGRQAGDACICGRRSAARAQPGHRRTCAWRTGLDGAVLPEPPMRLQPGMRADFIVETLLPSRPAR